MPSTIKKINLNNQKYLQKKSPFIFFWKAKCFVVDVKHYVLFLVSCGTVALYGPFFFFGGP